MRNETVTRETGLVLEGERLRARKFSEGTRLARFVRDKRECGILKPPRYSLPSLEETHYYYACDKG
jgi:hypothetical protein